jgi:hypothetical protein
MLGMKEAAARFLRKQAEGEALYKEPISTVMFARIADKLHGRNLRPEDVSIVLTAADFDALVIGVGAAAAGTARLRICGTEVLCGDKDTRICIHPRVPLGKADREALAVEILRCLGRYRVGKLPQSASGNGVSPDVETVGKVGVAPSPASSDNRDAHLTAEQAKELKIVAAKAAIAAYARDKKLPSAEQLAAFRELDDVRSPNKALGAALRASIRAEVIKEIYRDRHSLSSEALGRATDQIRISQSSGPYRDFVGAATQQLTEMID